MNKKELKDCVTKQLAYKSWEAMIQRCENKNNDNYKNYGDRGITVCEKWHNSRVFLKDMGERKSRLYSIDRIDNNKGYYPENCKWSLAKEQRRNSTTNRLITINGVKKCIAEWSEIYKMNRNTAHTRLNRGWIGESIFTGVR